MSLGQQLKIQRLTSFAITSSLRRIVVLSVIVLLTTRTEITAARALVSDERPAAAHSDDIAYDRINQHPSF